MHIIHSMDGWMDGWMDVVGGVSSWMNTKQEQNLQGSVSSLTCSKKENAVLFPPPAWNKKKEKEYYFINCFELVIYSCRIKI